MEARKPVWTAAFVALTLQVLIFRCTFLSAAHLRPMQSSRDTAFDIDTSDEYSSNQLLPFREVKNKDKDENNKSEGRDMIDGTNGLHNTSEVLDCGPGYIDCPDGNSCCRSGETCCPDVDGNGVMECCPIPNLTDIDTQCCKGVLKCCYPGLTCVVENGEFVKCDPDTLPILYRWMYREYEAKQKP